MTDQACEPARPGQTPEAPLARGNAAPSASRTADATAAPSAYHAALRRRNDARPPLWLMRQAGRYHSHYQKLRAQHEFIELCRRPELAAAVTYGPIDEFDFDAAILFSDLLFPLEALGMGLRYEPGPALDWHLRSPADLARLSAAPQKGYFDFQGDALKLIRRRLPPQKAVIGFVGAPLTHYFYAVAGTHQRRGPQGFEDVLEGFSDGRFDGFCERVLPLLEDEMVVQADAGADAVAVFDTCAGEVSSGLYRDRVVPFLRVLLERFSGRRPEVPVTYYSKGTGPDYWSSLEELPIMGLGIDWSHDLAEVLERWGDRFSIQGNLDPSWLLLETAELERRARAVFERVLALAPEKRRGWVCGLGHGVLPATPERNVRALVALQREMFS